MGPTEGLASRGLQSRAKRTLGGRWCSGPGPRSGPRPQEDHHVPHDPTPEPPGPHPPEPATPDALFIEDIDADDEPDVIDAGEADPLSPPPPPPLAEDVDGPEPTGDHPETLSDGPDLVSDEPDLISDKPETVSDRPEPDVDGLEPPSHEARLDVDHAEPLSDRLDTDVDEVDTGTSLSEPGALAAEADRQPGEVEPSALPVPPPEIVETAREATRNGGRELVQLVVRYGKAHLPETAGKEPYVDAGPPRMVGRIGQLIPILAVIPWLLAALFALSFWWDFDGRAVVLFGETFSVEGLLRVLTVSGLIGFGTNWLAITMLFQPREKRAIIPQGLIPAQRERVIYRLSEAISRELINADIIKQKIKDSGVIGRYRDLALGLVRGVVEDAGFRTELKTLAQAYATEVLGSESVRREVARLAVEKVEQQAGQGLGGMALRLYRTFAESDFQRRVDRALDELPEAVVPLLDRIDTALDAVPAKVEARADEIEEAATKAVLTFVESFDVRAMISDRARQFDEGQLEGLLKSTSNEQLNYIKYLGGILGVLGGFVIWQPLASLVLFVTVGLVLWGLDEALVRARRAREKA